MFVRLSLFLEQCLVNRRDLVGDLTHVEMKRRQWPTGLRPPGHPGHLPCLCCDRMLCPQNLLSIQARLQRAVSSGLETLQAVSTPPPISQPTSLAGSWAGAVCLLPLRGRLLESRGGVSPTGCL